MSYKSFGITGLSLLILSNVFAQQPEIWRNPEIYAINKEPAHAEFVLFDNRDDALAPLNLANPWSSSCYQSLNGEWDFNWYGDYKKVPADWYATNSSIEKWGTMPVPGMWQLNGYDRLYYINVTMPFEFDWETGERVKGFRKDDIEQSKESGHIPDAAQTIGCYRKWIEIPEDRLDDRVVLRIGAVEAGVQVFVNGKDAGYSQGSMTPAEFEISKHLNKGKNLIGLKVFRWTDGSYMEVQDMIRFTGIYRDVFLRFEPRQRVTDIKFTGTPDESLNTIDATYEISVSNQNSKKLKRAKLKFELLPEGGTQAVESWTTEVAPVESNSLVKVSGRLEMKDLKLWSPDKPQLYTLIVSLLDSKGKAIQHTRSDVGFRRFEEIDGNFYLNGQRFFIWGVNRHDHHARYGKYVPTANMIRDLELMKQSNINTVRTSHYPNDDRWYYLCNRYGMAIIDEANVESHDFNDVPGNRPQWMAAAVDRVESVVQRDKNHPSVFIWSLGNEQGWGWNKTFDKQFDRAKELDDSRMVMCDRGNLTGPDWVPENQRVVYNETRLDKPNTISPMYGTLEKQADYVNKRDKEKRPFFMCEYRHAMGNAVGALKEVWDMVYANEENGLNGGCIWDWMDQGVEARDEKGTLYYQYGGDWGDAINTRFNFCLNGLILPDQGWTPKLEEVRKCYEPFHVKALSLDNGQFQVRNLLIQTDLNDFKTGWQLRENGKVVQWGTLDGLSAVPGEKKRFKIPYDASRLATDKEYYLRIGFELKEDASWADKGHELTFSEFKLEGNYEYPLSTSAKAPIVEQDEFTTRIRTGKGVQLAFHNASGRLISFKVKEKELLTESDRDYLFDFNLAWIDNFYRRGRFHMKDYLNLQLEEIVRLDSAKLTVEEKENSVIVTIQNTFMSPEEAGYTETQTWTIDGLGQVIMDEHVAPTGKLTPDVWIPRLGLRIPLKPEFSQLSYYGLGPHGNYPDRSYGSWTGFHSSNVADNYVPYPKPQDHGNREKVRWMKITDEEGTGIKVYAPQALSMSALPYSQDELHKASHTTGLPEESTITELRIAAKVTGIGNGSCGPITDPEYQTRAEETEYRVVFIPMDKAPWKYESFVKPLGLFPKSTFGYWVYEGGEKFHQANINDYILEWKDRDLPLNGILLEGISWQNEANDLRWNEHYPEPAKMIGELNNMGISLGLWENGWLDPNSSNWDEAMEKGWLIPGTGKNWTGSRKEESLKFDTQDPECVAWWMKQHESLLDLKVINFKLDAGLNPRGNLSSLYLAEPFALQAEQYSRKRILTLKCWGGWGRDHEEVTTGLWLGDPLPIWQACSDNLLCAIINGLTGQWFFGPEIGALDGRKGYPTSAELFIRWTQWGMCAPHPSAMGGRSGQHPWKYGEDSEDNFRTFGKWRMRLMPYVYSYNWNAYRTKEPLMRALAIDFPDDPLCDFPYYSTNPMHLYNRSKNNPHDYIDIGETERTDPSLFANQEYHQFMFGREILVAPVVWEGLTVRDVYLPAGAEWIDYKDGKTVYEGGQTLKDYPAPLDEMPRFVRAGSIIPMGPDMHYVDEKPLDELTLDIYPSTRKEASFTLYEDDGISLEYRRGKYATTEIHCSSLSGNKLTVDVEAASGEYPAMVKQRKVLLNIHLMDKPEKVSVNGDEVTGWSYDADKRLVYVEYTQATHTAVQTVVYK